MLGIPPPRVSSLQSLGLETRRNTVHLAPTNQKNQIGVGSLADLNCKRDSFDDGVDPCPTIGQPLGRIQRSV